MEPSNECEYCGCKFTGMTVVVEKQPMGSKQWYEYCSLECFDNHKDELEVDVND